MSFSNAPLIAPDAEDFRRIGLRRAEFRPLIIRLALNRAATVTVESMPAVGSSLERSQKVSEVLISGYRVMDPRRRSDSQQRAMLGRLHVQVLEESLGLSSLSIPGGNRDRKSRTGFRSSEDSQRHRWGVFTSEAVSVDDLLEERVANLWGVGSFAPVANAGMQSAGDLSRWRATLSATDLLNPPLRLRALRAFRRGTAFWSPVFRVTAALLAASVLLLLSRGTTAWLRGGVGSSGAAFAQAGIPESRSTNGKPGDEQADPTLRVVGADSEDRLEILGRTVAQGSDDPEVAADLRMLGAEPLVSPALDPLALDPLALDPFGPGRLAETVAVEPLPDEIVMAEFLEIRPVLNSVSQTAERLLAGTGVVSASSVERVPSALPVGAVNGDVIANSEMASVHLDAQRFVTNPAAAGGDGVVGRQMPSADQLASCRPSVEREANDRIGRMEEAWKVYRQMARESAVGSVEGWVAWLNAGQSAILERRYYAAQWVIAEMAEWTGLDPLAATCETAEWATAEVSMGEPLKAVSEWLDRGIRNHLVQGDLAAAESLLDVLRAMGSRNRDAEITLVSREWNDVLEQALRLQDSLDASGPNQNDSEWSVDERVAAGRYWALVRRDWTRALPYLAAGGAGRFSRLALMESMVVGAPDPDTAIRLAEGYLREGSTHKGWLAESLAVHAHQLLVAAAGASASATVALDLRRRASAIEALYPRAFMPLEDVSEPAPGVIGGSETSTSAGPIRPDTGRVDLAFF